MERTRLDLDQLNVDSFATESPAFSISTGGMGYCCTGCVSGCGYNPTASGCDSGGTDPFTVAQAAAID
jgi:hypothetical protein